MIINDKSLIIDSVIIGKPSREALDTAAMILAQSYMNREVENG